MKRSYTELLTFPTFKERLEYLSIRGLVGNATFGGLRYLNQNLYRSKEWRQFRDSIILRDMCCDLACEDHEILSYRVNDSGKRIPVYTITVHHINPLTVEDVRNNPNRIFDPENVITCTDVTHRAIHYGDTRTTELTDLVIRKPNDTCPWRYP